MNINLVPKVISEINSRDEIDISTDFCGIKLKIPIIASPMVDVCNGRIAKTMYNNGAYGIIHRFNTIESQVEEFLTAEKNAGCAIGLQDGIERFKYLYKEGCKIFCIDTANGANKNVFRLIDEIFNTSIAYKYGQDYHLIIGNVASGVCYKELCFRRNVSGVRLLIGSGAACETTKSTGIYNNPFLLLKECEIEEEKIPRIPQSVSKIIDGGIKEPGDFSKCIALGANVIMIGSLIAACTDSCAKMVNVNHDIYKKYRGSSSFEIQNSYKEPRYIEGTLRLLPQSDENISEMLNRFANGLKSCCSYFNAKNLQELRKNITFNYTD